jgi:hypothetical protein
MFKKLENSIREILIYVLYIYHMKDGLNVILVFVFYTFDNRGHCMKIKMLPLRGWIIFTEYLIVYCHSGNVEQHSLA